MIENWPILSILIFLPIFGAFLILLIPNKIDQEGKILKNWTNVKVKDHAKDVLKTLKNIIK